MSRQVDQPPAVTRRLGRSLLLASTLVLVGAGPAAAHVTVTPSTTQAGASAIVQVSVGHGCEGSPTTAIEIRIPESVYSVTPTRNPLWEISVDREPVVPPVTDEHGTRITDRVSSVTYRTDTPLPDGQRDTFELALRLPADVGGAVVFPTIQTCEKGESAWIEVPATGQDPESLDHPAPAFVLTAEGATTPASADAADAVELVARAGSSSSSSGTCLLALGALGVGLAGLLVALACLTRLRRQRS